MRSIEEIRTISKENKDKAKVMIEGFILTGLLTPYEVIDVVLSFARDHEGQLDKDTKIRIMELMDMLG
jgi:hypothetical protein